MGKLICAKCMRSNMTWLDPYRDDLLDNGIMKCDDPECGAEFVGILGWQTAWENKKLTKATGDSAK